MSVSDAAIAQAFREFPEGHSAAKTMRWQYVRRQLLDRARDLDAEKGGWLCPRCDAPEKERERRPNGNSTCVNGHGYPSLHAKPATPPAQAAEAVVERVAIAMYEDECDGNYNPWGNASKYVREVWTDRARAAIAAMQAGEVGLALLDTMRDGIGATLNGKRVPPGQIAEVFGMKVVHDPSMAPGVVKLVQDGKTLIQVQGVTELNAAIDAAPKAIIYAKLSEQLATGKYAGMSVDAAICAALDELARKEAT